jgi:hypothetical protein
MFMTTTSDRSRTIVTNGRHFKLERFAPGSLGQPDHGILKAGVFGDFKLL